MNFPRSKAEPCAGPHAERLTSPTRGKACATPGCRGREFRCATCLWWITECPCGFLVGATRSSSLHAPSVKASCRTRKRTPKRHCACGMFASKGSDKCRRCLRGEPRRVGPFGVNPVTGKPGTAPIPARAGDKKQARATVTHAVNRGVLPHPNTLPCTDCQHTVTSDADRRHEYDHFQGYAPEHHMSVEAVCTRCHKRRGYVRGEHAPPRRAKA